VIAVECAGPLDGDVGATQTCRVSFSSGLLQVVTAEVTAVDGARVDYGTSRGDKLVTGSTLSAIAREYLEEPGA